MFNEWDRRCVTVQRMLSIDSSYDNRIIANTLKMQIWIATNNRDVPRGRKRKFLATVMVFGVVSNEGHIMPPHIFEVGLKVNTKVYLDVLKSVVIPWCNQVAGGRPWVWQQDSAPAHKSKETQTWLQKECYDFVPFSHWSPSSPTWTHWTTSFGHMLRTSSTWLPTTPKPACPVSWGCRIHWLHLCRGVRPPTECPGYDTKQSDGEVPAVLVLWGMRSTPSLPSLPGPLWPGVVAPDKALSMG